MSSINFLKLLIIVSTISALFFSCDSLVNAIVDEFNSERPTPYQSIDKDKTENSQEPLSF